MVLLMAFLAKVHMDPLNKDWEEKKQLMDWVVKLSEWFMGLQSRISYLVLYILRFTETLQSFC